ncbi:hypothetical protein VTK26DRAFT_7040 [Humicola hyalothermophila]
MDGTEQRDAGEQADVAMTTTLSPKNVNAPSPGMAVESESQRPTAPPPSTAPTTVAHTGTGVNLTATTGTQPASPESAPARTTPAPASHPAAVDGQQSPPQSQPGSNAAAGPGPQGNNYWVRWKEPTTTTVQPGKAKPPALFGVSGAMTGGSAAPQGPQPTPQAPQQQQHDGQQNPPLHPQSQHLPAPAPTPLPPPPTPPPPSTHLHAAPQHPQARPHLHSDTPEHPHQTHQPSPLQSPAPHTRPQIPQHPHHHPQEQQQQHQHPHHPHHHQQQQQQPPPPPSPAATLPPLRHYQAVPQPSVLLPSQAAPRAPLSKPVIMDPPAVRRASQQPQQQAVGFPSPTADHARINPKFVDDCTRINYAVQQSLPEAVRRIIRDHWEKCLMGSEFHQAFVLNASIHHASPLVTRRAVCDFGRKMVSESKHELIQHFTTADLDEVADLIISKASDSFLDKCLEKRLLTIEAKPLINALAKAERLGYDSSDIIQDAHNERVIPQEAYPGAVTATDGYRGQPGQLPHAQSPQQQAQCMRCYRTFVATSAYDYHMRYNVCSQLPPTAKGFEHSCPHCGQGFTNTNDLETHGANKVCGDFRPVPPAGLPGRPPRATPATQPDPTPIPPSTSTQRPTTNGYSATQLQSTPVHSSVARRAAATPGSASSPNPDPYAHLTEEQLEQMNQELQAAEAKYAPRFAEAEQIADENLRKQKIEGLRNSFGTKQSMIRKKFGVRLRERRTKAEIMAERERLGLKRVEKEKTRNPTANQQHNLSPTANADATQPRSTGGSGWTAANTPRGANSVWDEHDAKRRRTDGSGNYQTPYKSLANDTPSRKTLSVSEMGGGLSGTSATAATHDPTLPPPSQPTRVYEQSSARVEIHEPAKPNPPVADTSFVKPEVRSGAATPTTEDPGSSVNGRRHPQSATPEAPVAAVEPSDSSSDDDEEDIPSTLPAHRRRSVPGSTSLLKTT